MEISGGNAFSNALTGMQAGQWRVDQAAGQIASNAVATSQPVNQPVVDGSAERSQVNNLRDAMRGPDDVAGSIVELRAGRNDVQSNLQVVKTADEILGTAIDIQA